MASRKDRERFERMMLGYLDAAYNLALWLLRDASDAEDVVQTAYLKAFEHFDSFNGGNAAGWIMTIVRNTAYNHLTKQKRSGNLVNFDEALHSSETHSRSALNSLTPEDIVSVASSNSVMMALVERLPTEFRETLFLRELEGYSYKEIAEMTQVPKGTVMSRLSRARIQLRKMLTDQQKRKQSNDL